MDGEEEVGVDEVFVEEFFDAFLFFEPGGVCIAFSADIFVGVPDAVLYAFGVEGAEGGVAFMEFGAVDFFHGYTSFEGKELGLGGRG